MEKERGIRYFPIALFASVMGFAGVTMAIKHMESILGWNHMLSNVLLILTTVLFIVNGGIALFRFARHLDDVKEDFQHPVKMNFFGAVPISLLLLAAAYYSLSQKVSFVLWGVGAILQLSLTVMILSKLVRQSHFQLKNFNPAWFIPIVGNVVVPIAGAFHTVPDVNWLFFSIGLLFSIIYLTLFTNRIFFYPMLPKPLQPTMFILMAPPAIGFVSYVNLVGHVDVFAYILFGIAFFIGLLLLFHLKNFIRLPFFLSWWAFLFPSAAMTIATITMYNVLGNEIYFWLVMIQVIGLIILLLYLTWKTMQLVLARKLCAKK